MKKIAIVFLTSAVFLVACEKDCPTDIKTVPVNEAFTLVVGQSAELASDGFKITLLGITEDSRCPVNDGVACFWEGRVVAEFRAEKDGEQVIETLTDNPASQLSLYTEFLAFGHLVKYVDIMPEADIDPIPQGEYTVKLEVE